MISDCPPTSRPYVVRLLSFAKEVSYRELARRIGEHRSFFNRRLKDKEMADELFERLIKALEASPGEVALATSFHEGILALAFPSAIPGERDFVEIRILGLSRWYRRVLVDFGRFARADASVQKYPRAWDLEPARWRAGKLLEILVGLEAPVRLKAAALFTPLHVWPVVEAVVGESVRAASRSPKETLRWARIARQIAKRLQGPEGWRKSVQALAVGSFANALRVAGRLRAADRTLEAAKRLWNEGSDPDRILDPGLLLSFEASLRRDQRRLSEALDLLDKARLVSHEPARILIKKGFTLEVMGEFEKAVAAQTEAIPLLDFQRQPQLWYKSRSNLAVNLCNLGRYRDAAVLVRQAAPVARKLGDKLDLIRLSWLSGRIYRGLGETRRALELLGKAEKAFAANRMWYDVALALLERATVLLQDGRKAEARAVSAGLVGVFKGQGVHREALAALRLFYDTVQGGTATAELAQEVVFFLLRARYDRGLRFRS